MPPSPSARMSSAQELPVAVIGSGPCGAVAARVLGEHGIRVVVYEAGTRQRGALMKIRDVTIFRKSAALRPLESHSSPSANAWHSNAALGGLSNQWTGAVPRYSREDFLEPAGLGQEFEWPISYDELVPYYEYCERHLNVVGSGRSHAVLPANVVAREAALRGEWQELADGPVKRGGDLLCPVPLASGFRTGVATRSTPFNAFDALLSPPGLPRTVRVMSGQRVVKIGTNQTTGLATSITVEDQSNGLKKEVAVRAVVVAAGAIATPLLLLRSVGDRHPDGLANENGLVGRYLHDHVSHAFLLGLKTPMPRLRHVAYFGRAEYGSQSPLTAGQATIGARHSRMDRLLAPTPSPTTRFGVVVFATSLPRPENRISLDGEGGARISATFTDRDVAGALETERRVTTALRRASLGPSVLWSDSMHTVGKAVHYAGGARMHRDEKFGVVDEWNRVWSAPNVVVADASSFTASSEKNPTLTAMAISARAASGLALELGGCPGRATAKTFG